MSETVVSGMRPTGKLHLGNYFGALKSWVELQNTDECYFFVADWHALTTGYEETEDLQKNCFEVVVDWLAAGLDPDKTVIFLQSDVPEHAELHLLLEMITPVPWLERNPTYKAARQELGKNQTANLGFLSYPVLQTADILAYSATRVPVGEDQKPHLELGREIVRRFNHLYDAELPEMLPLLRQTPHLLGTDGRKMSKSYDNCIYLSDSPEERRAKIMKAKTDMGSEPGAKIPSDGPVGNLFMMLELFATADKLSHYKELYRTGKIQYGYMKEAIADAMNNYFKSFDRRRAEFLKQPELIEKILNDGKIKARQRAQKTLQTVKEKIGLA